MKALNNIFTVLLILAMVPIGIPMHVQEDVSLDGIVDLNDAILLVQDISAQENNKRIFSANFKNLLSALKSVADLQSCQEDSDTLPADSNKSASTIRADIAALIPSSVTLPILSPILTNLFDYQKPYQSHKVSPPTPPPRKTA